jgi:uncharacterized OB-fold protein
MVNASHPSYLPGEISTIFPDATSREFWDRCAQHQLAFQRCRVCGTFRNPPGPICYVCRSTETAWVPVTGDGTLFSYTIVTHAVHPALQEALPFNVALVEFPDAPDVRLVTNVVDAAPEELEIGMRVRLHWEDLSNASLPRFEKA